jgi:hypothetical protein
MAPQLGGVANPFGVPVMRGGGFDSLTDKYNFRLRYLKSLGGRPIFNAETRSCLRRSSSRPGYP